MYGLAGQPGIETVIPDIKEDYKNEVIIQSNTLYYKYVNTEDSEKRVKWCKETGIPVWGYSEGEIEDEDEGNYDKIDTNVDEITPEESTYKKVGNIYLNTPDLSNLNPKSTYYITYDKDGKNPKIYGRIDRVEAPDDWYNYETKMYANIVTVTNNQVAYWVWIPRYKYVLNNDTQSVDAKFISKDDKYINSDGSEETLDSSFILPEAFTFNSTQLNGYWMSKYEISEFGGQELLVNTDISKLTVSSSIIEEGNYQVYINGKLQYTGTLPYTAIGLEPGTTYEVTLVKDGKMLGNKEVTTETIYVDISNFNPEATYYVTYDENGQNMQIANRIDKGPAPSNWYDYAKKRWANIVTITNQEVAFWVYVPRYAYILNTESQRVDVEFVTKNVKNNSSGVYQIPEAFTFNSKELSGFWISKYEISEGTADQLTVSSNINTITVSAGNSEGDDFKVYIDGELKHTGKLPYTIEKVQEGKEYDVCLMKGNMPIGRQKVTTKTIEVDLSNLDKENTYYVYWDENGQEHSDIPISKSPPKNWYDYSQKRWANIVTKANGQIAYWVWVPRYAYKLNNTTQTVSIEFVTKDVKNNSSGVYQIPEAFTFNGKELSGFWISKYEISEEIKQ